MKNTECLMCFSELSESNVDWASGVTDMTQYIEYFYK
jgi:hypothetical protein